MHISTTNWAQLGGNASADEKPSLNQGSAVRRQLRRDQRVINRTDRLYSTVIQQVNETKKGKKESAESLPKPTQGRFEQCLPHLIGS
jgi:hypothetical protein